MNQKQKTIETYKEKDKVKVFDEARNKYLYQKHKHKIESSFLKKAIKSLKKNKLKWRMEINFTKEILKAP